VYDAAIPLNNVKSFAEAQEAISDLTGSEYAVELIRRVGKVVFAYVNHFTIVSLVPVMVDPSARSRMRLISFSSGLAMTIYMMAGLGGYMRFGKYAGEAGDILGVYGDEAPIVYTIARLLLALVLICSYPLLLDPARSCLDSLVFGPTSNLSKSFRHYLETALIVAIPVGVAFASGDKSDKFLDLFAGFCGSLLVFTLPGLFYLKLSKSFKFQISQAERVMAFFCIVLGLILAVASTYFNVLAFFPKKVVSGSSEI
jgi:amino acid permease